MPRMDITEAPEIATSSKWVVIVQDKKSTYRYELLDSGVANVFKSVDDLTPKYQIKDGICSCPAAYHSKVCKHVKTVQRSLAG